MQGFLKPQVKNARIMPSATALSRTIVSCCPVRCNCLDQRTAMTVIQWSSCLVHLYILWLIMGCYLSSTSAYMGRSLTNINANTATSPLPEGKETADVESAKNGSSMSAGGWVWKSSGGELVMKWWSLISLTSFHFSPSQSFTLTTHTRSIF
jgi:hypothetical protein